MTAADSVLGAPRQAGAGGKAAYHRIEDGDCECQDGAAPQCTVCESTVKRSRVRDLVVQQVHQHAQRQRIVVTGDAGAAPECFKAPGAKRFPEASRIMV